MRLALLCISWLLFSDPFPIAISISETKIVHDIPSKSKDFAFSLPGEGQTFIYHVESEYYNDYQRSYFALTKEAGGWDRLRHYEILANGCIPYFLDIENCPPKTMHLLPRKLILEAMHLPGVSRFHSIRIPMRIDHARFDRKRYFEILAELLDYTRKVLSSRAVAQYLLRTVGYSGKGKILYLSQDVYPDYVRCCTLIGLKELLGTAVVDVPKINHIYTSYPLDTHSMYGRGFTYTKIVEDLPVDRDNIEDRIRAQAFDLVIYGSVHRGLPFHDLVKQVYPQEKIVYLCGEDKHQCPYTHYPNLFLREFP